MKQMMMLFSIVFFCNTFGIAQKTISKEEFEHLVDYANCRYIMTFIEENDKDKPYFTDTYEKKIKPVLKKASLDNFETILNFQELSDLLVGNKPAADLAKKINERKLKFDKFQDNDSLILSLKSDKWGNIDLSALAESITNEILGKYNTATNEVDYSNLSESKPSVQDSTQIDKYQSGLDELKTQYGNLNKSFRNFRIITYIILVFFFGLIFILYLLLRKGKLREFIINQVIGSKRVEEKFILSKSQSYTLTDKDLNTIADRVLECKLLNEKEAQKQSQALSKADNLPMKSASKYLKGKSGKMFNRTENTSENSFFKLMNETSDTAQFEFSGDEAEAIAKRIFSEDICKIVSGGYQDAKSVKTQRPGKIKRIGEQWVVIEPVEIKLI